jgi:putative sigma-54 modulation protein
MDVPDLPLARSACVKPPVQVSRSRRPPARDESLESPFVQIQISTRHGHLSEESRERITGKLEKLLKIFDRLTAIEVIIDLTDSTTPKVDLMVSAEHKHDFVARHESESLTGSLDVVIHRLEQQLRKYKERVVERHRNADPRRRVETLKPEAEGE